MKPYYTIRELNDPKIQFTDHFQILTYCHQNKLSGIITLRKHLPNRTILVANRFFLTRPYIQDRTGWGH